VPEGLTIPIRLDPSKSVKGLHDVGDAGRKAGDDVHGGMKHGQEGTESLLSSMLEMGLAEKAFEKVVEVGESISETMKEAAEHTRETAREFVSLQHEMAEVAALSGKQTTRNLTMEEIRKAEGAHLTPEQWVQSRKAFMAQGQAFVGAGPGAKMTAEDADKVQAQIAELEKAKGAPTGSLTGLAGSMLAQEKESISAKDFLVKFGKVHGVLEGVGGPVGERAAAMSKLQAQGFSAEGAAETLAMMKRVAPGREAFALQTVQMGIEEGVTKGTIGQRQGVKEGMGPEEELKAVTTYLHKRMETGKTPEEQTKIVQREVAEMTTSPRAKNMLARLAREGVAGYEAAGARMAAIPADEVEKQIEAHRDTALGKDEAAEAHLKAAEAKTGARYAGVARLKTEAQARLEEEGRFQEVRPAEDIARKVLGVILQTTPKEQVIGERARQLAEAQAGETHAKLPVLPGYATDELTRRSLNKVDKENIDADRQERMHRELVRQTQLLDEIARQGKQKEVPPPKAALHAPPPPGAGRFGGG